MSKELTTEVHDELYQRFIDKCNSEQRTPSEVLKELVYKHTSIPELKNADDILKHIRRKHENNNVPIASFASQKEAEEFLILYGWEHVLTEEDGCDSWSYPWELRKYWPQWAQKGMSGNQHYWDREEAIALQMEIGIS